AVGLKDSALARLLLERGADPNLWVEYGTYLMSDLACGQHMLALLKRFGAKSESDPDVAIPAMSARLRETPGDVDARIQRARAWREVAQYERALADIDIALEADDMPRGAEFVKCWILASCPDERFRNGEEAVALAEKIETTYLLGFGR